MDEWDEEDEVVPVAAYHFSFYGLATDTCACLARICAAGAQFWEDTCNNFARAHNLQVDRFDAKSDGEKFATDVMSGLKDL